MSEPAMRRALRALWCLSLATHLVAITFVSGAFGQTANEDLSDMYYQKALDSYYKRNYAEARQYFDSAKKLTARNSPGSRVFEALLNIQTGKPKTGYDVLKTEQPLAEEERTRLQKQFYTARRETRFADAEDLKKRAERADERVMQIEAGLKRAAELIAKVYITVPQDQRERDLSVRLDGRLVDLSFWDGQGAIDVDLGFHTVEAMTGDRALVRYSVTEEANPQRPVRVLVRLSAIPKPFPVPGFKALKDEMDSKVKMLGETSNTLQRSHDPKSRCYEKAWKYLTSISSAAEGLGEALLVEPAKDSEDDIEVTKIRHLIQYEVEPCLDDCLKGRNMCNAETDYPMRIWPGRGSCTACAIGASEASDTSLSDQFSLTLILASGIAARLRRRRHQSHTPSPLKTRAKSCPTKNWS